LGAKAVQKALAGDASVCCWARWCDRAVEFELSKIETAADA
jgi:hypothetical protein